MILAMFPLLHPLCFFSCVLAHLHGDRFFADTQSLVMYAIAVCICIDIELYLKLTQHWSNTIEPCSGALESYAYKMCV